MASPKPEPTPLPMDIAMDIVMDTVMDIDKPEELLSPLPQPVPSPPPAPAADSNNPAPQAPLLVSAAPEESAPAPVAPLPSLEPLQSLQSLQSLEPLDLELLESRPPTPSAELVTAEPENTTYHSPTASEYEPDENSPPPRPPMRFKTTPKVIFKPPKPKIHRVISGRIELSHSPGGGSLGGPATTLKCPVKGCGQTFTGRNPRQSLWHHLKYYATRGLPDKEDFEKAHGEAHSLMKEEAG